MRAFEYTDKTVNQVNVVKSREDVPPMLFVDIST